MIQTEKQKAFELIGTLIELKQNEIPVLFNLYRNPEKKDMVLNLVFEHFINGGASSYEHAVYAVNRNFDINAFVD